MAQKILHADDEESMGMLYEHFHERAYPEYKLVRYQDGTSLQKGLEELAGDGVVLVITDNDMPGMTGSEIIKKFARDPRYAHIKFILSYGGPENIGREAVDNGAFAYIMKPYRMVSQLEPLIDRALGIKRDITSS